MGEIYMRLSEKLPETIRAFTMLDRNGDYNVYVNAKIGMEMQTKALKHELEHIKQGDMYSIISVTELELKLREKGM